MVADVVTKRLVMSRLAYGIPHDVLGDVVRFTLVFNRGAAFGTTVGEASRWIFTALALAILFVLVRMNSCASSVHGEIALVIVCSRSGPKPNTRYASS